MGSFDAGMALGIRAFNTAEASRLAQDENRRRQELHDLQKMQSESQLDTQRQWMALAGDQAAGNEMDPAAMAGDRKSVV